MSRRATLAELRHLALAMLDVHDDEWITTTQLADRLGLDHGLDYYRLALTLERLANDGLAELKTPGATVRRFRRSMTQGGGGSSKAIEAPLPASPREKLAATPARSEFIFWRGGGGVAGRPSVSRGTHPPGKRVSRETRAALTPLPVIRSLPEGENARE